MSDRFCYSKTVADLKVRFPSLQEGMKGLLASEMEKVVREEKWVCILTVIWMQLRQPAVVQHWASVEYLFGISTLFTGM